MQRDTGKGSGVQTVDALEDMLRCVNIALKRMENVIGALMVSSKAAQG